MASATTAFFEELAQRGYEPALQRVTGTVRFDIAEEGSWWVAVVDGAVTVRRDAARADCVLSFTAADFNAIVRRERNPLTAAMQGRVQITGNPGMALIIQCTCH